MTSCPALEGGNWWPLYLAIVLVCLAAAGYPIGRSLGWWLGRSEGRKQFEALKAALVDLQDRTPSATAPPPESAKYLCERAQTMLDRRIAVEGEIEKKLSGLLTIVGGGAGIITVFLSTQQGTSAGKTPLQISPLVIAASIALLTTLAICVFALYPKIRGLSGAEANLGRLVQSNLDECAVASQFAGYFFALTASYRHSSQVKRACYFSAAFTFLVVVICSAMNAFLLAKAGCVK